MRLRPHLHLSALSALSMLASVLARLLGRGSADACDSFSWPLLPKHGGKGMHGAAVHRAVIAAGEAESGATVHLVDEVYDRGTILAQGRVAVPQRATAELLAAAVLTVEHRLLPAAVRAAAMAGHPVPFEFA